MDKDKGEVTIIIKEEDEIKETDVNEEKYQEKNLEEKTKVN